MPLEGWRAPLGSVVLLNTEGSGLHATVHTSMGPANLKVNLRCSTAAKSRWAANKMAWMKCARCLFEITEIMVINGDFGSCLGSLLSGALRNLKVSIGLVEGY